MQTKKMKKQLYICFMSCLFSAAAWSQYLGGNSNGFTNIVNNTVDLSFTDSLFNGGNANGFSVSNSYLLILGLQDSVFKGGSNNGFNSSQALVLLGKGDSLYNGGNGKGETMLVVTGANLAICSDTLYWNGNANTQWNNPANWDCGSIPGINSIVIIEAGKPHYPIITVNTEIKKLDLRPGAAVVVFTGKTLTINGTQ